MVNKTWQLVTTGYIEYNFTAKLSNITSCTQNTSSIFKINVSEDEHTTSSSDKFIFLLEKKIKEFVI